MLDEFRKYLVFLQKQRRKDFNKTVQIFSLVIFLYVVFGVIIDVFTEPSFFTNLIKGFIALNGGASIFSLVYMIFYEAITNVDNESKKEFSYRQRINLSIISFLIMMFIFVFFVSPNSWAYTICGGFIISLIGFILAFVRPTRDEYIRMSYNLQDDRDLMYYKEIEEREKKLAEEKEKEEDE